MGKKNKMKMKNNKAKAKMKWLKRDTGNAGIVNQGNKRKLAFANAISGIGPVFKHPKLIASQNAVSVLKKTPNAAVPQEALVQDPPKSVTNPMIRHRNSLPIFAARSRLKFT